MIKNLLCDLKKSTTKEEFNLILKIAKEDISFHKKIGTSYSAERVASVLNQTAILVTRLQ